MIQLLAGGFTCLLNEYTKHTLITSFIIFGNNFLTIFDLFKKSLQVIFVSETNSEPLHHQEEIKKEPKILLQQTIVTADEIWVGFMNKNCIQ